MVTAAFCRVAGMNTGLTLQSFLKLVVTPANAGSRAGGGAVALDFPLSRE
jgi:hypothetical protein